MPTVRRLKTHSDVRQTLAWCWRELEGDRLDVKKAKALAYIALSISQVLTGTELEARIAALETSHAERMKRSHR